MMMNDVAGDDGGISLDRVTREVEYGPRGKRRRRHRKFSHWIKGDADASLFVGDGIIRNYQVIDGKLVFLCYGRAITIRERPINIVVLVLMFTAAGLYLGFMYVLLPDFTRGCLSVPMTIWPEFGYFQQLTCSAPWTWHHVSPAVPIIFAYCFCICIGSFLRASTMDPGVSTLVSDL
jgi:hypothetical protein